MKNIFPEELKSQSMSTETKYTENSSSFNLTSLLLRLKQDKSFLIFRYSVFFLQWTREKGLANVFLGAVSGEGDNPIIPSLSLYPHPTPHTQIFLTTKEALISFHEFQSKARKMFMTLSIFITLNFPFLKNSGQGSRMLIKLCNT